MKDQLFVYVWMFFYKHLVVQLDLEIQELNNQKFLHKEYQPHIHYVLVTGYYSLFHLTLNLIQHIELIVVALDHLLSERELLKQQYN